MEAIFVIFIVFMYFIPSMVAASCDNKNTHAISILNVFTGWTFIGWVVCLVWAVKK
jgi:hypothetical protein